MDRDEISYDYLLRHFYKLPVDAVMRRDLSNIPILERKASIEDVLSILSARRHVWIVEDKNSMKLVGVITEKDILELLLPERLPPYIVGSINIKSMLFKNIKYAEEIMNSNLVIIETHHPIEEAISKMHKYKCYRLPVLDKGRLIGEISIRLLVVQFLKVLKWHKILMQDTQKRQ